MERDQSRRMLERMEDMEKARLERMIREMTPPRDIQ